MAIDENGQFDWESMSAEEQGNYLQAAVPDCSFLVGIKPENTRLIKSYKAILSSVSPVFERMFNGAFVESRDPEKIKITDSEPDDFQNFLDRIINSKMCALFDCCDAPAITFIIFCLSRKYAVKEMEKEFKSKLLGFSRDLFSYYDLVRFFAFAVQIGDEDLLSKFKAIINWRFQNLSKPRWASNIYDLDEATFFQWFLCVYMRYTPIERFDFVEIYAKINHLERQPFKECVLEDMLELVDFKGMDAAAFRSGPAQSDILTSAEKRQFVSLYMSTK